MPSVESTLNLITQLLDDEDGISQNGFDALYAYIQELYLGEVPTKVDALIATAKSCNGRYYLPS